ncbi:hypothetical protein MKX01_011604, partial [Papaver californicum]
MLGLALSGLYRYRGVLQVTAKGIGASGIILSSYTCSKNLQLLCIDSSSPSASVKDDGSIKHPQQEFLCPSKREKERMTMVSSNMVQRHKPQQQRGFQVSCRKKRDYRENNNSPFK